MAVTFCEGRAEGGRMYRDLQCLMHNALCVLDTGWLRRRVRGELRRVEVMAWELLQNLKQHPPNPSPFPFGNGQVNVAFFNGSRTEANVSRGCYFSPVFISLSFPPLTVVQTDALTCNLEKVQLKKKWLFWHNLKSFSRKITFSPNREPACQKSNLQIRQTNKSGCESANSNSVCSSRPRNNYVVITVMKIMILLSNYEAHLLQ